MVPGPWSQSGVLAPVVHGSGHKTLYHQLSLRSVISLVLAFGSRLHVSCPHSLWLWISGPHPPQTRGLWPWVSGPSPPDSWSVALGLRSEPSPDSWSVALGLGSAPSSGSWSVALGLGSEPSSDSWFLVSNLMEHRLSETWFTSHLHVPCPGQLNRLSNWKVFKLHGVAVGVTRCTPLQEPRFE